MMFDGEYFQQIFSVIMGTNVASILANMYMAKLENLLKEKCKTNKRIIWSLLFKIFIDDGFGITKTNKKEFEYWAGRETITINKFKYANTLDFMHLFVFKGDFFWTMENLIFLFFKKKKINVCIFRLSVDIKSIPLIISF